MRREPGGGGEGVMGHRECTGEQGQFRGCNDGSSDDAVRRKRQPQVQSKQWQQNRGVKQCIRNRDGGGSSWKQSRNESKHRGENK